MKKYTVLIADSAVSDIDDIVNWFLSVNNKYAKKLYYNLKKKILSLQEYPGKGRIVPELEKNGIHDYRELLEGNYRIIYSLRENSVYVLAIIDSRRNLDEILLKKAINPEEETLR